MGLRDWYLRRKVTGIVEDAERGEKGPMAQGAIESFKASPGYRSAVMLLLLVVEGGAKAAGFETGPVFGILRAAFGVMGVDSSEATALGVDPEKLIAGIFAVWFAVARLWAVYRERQSKAVADRAAATIVLPPPNEG